MWLFYRKISTLRLAVTYQHTIDNTIQAARLYETTVLDMVPILHRECEALAASRKSLET